MTLPTPMAAVRSKKPAGQETTADEILRKLKSLGSEQIKKILGRHGAREPFFGVKIEHLKKIQKRIKVNHPLALELYATGISDAMYLAALIADPAAMTQADLNRWVKGAYWGMLSEYAVPWVASESKHGWRLGLKWIESPEEMIACAGWSTLASVLSLSGSPAPDLAEVRNLLDRCVKTIHDQPNRVRYTMNGFVIGVGAYVPELTKAAQAAAKKIGKVNVDMGGTACKVPDAAEYIAKIERMGRIGKKRDSARC